MASLTMMASLSAAVAIDRRVQQQVAATPRRGLVVARAAKADGQQELAAKLAVESATYGRHAVVFAAAVSSFGGAASAESECGRPGVGVGGVGGLIREQQARNGVLNLPAVGLSRVE